jgi:hypothetical protein
MLIVLQTTVAARRSCDPDKQTLIYPHNNTLYSDTTEACSCVNCGRGEHRIARFGWTFRIVALYGQKLHADIASTGIDKYNGQRLSHKSVTYWCRKSYGPQRMPESGTVERLWAEYRQCCYCCRMADGVTGRSAVCWHRYGCGRTKGQVGVQIRALEVRPSKREPWQQKWTVATAHVHHVSLTTNMWVYSGNTSTTSRSPSSACLPHANKLLSRGTLPPLSIPRVVIYRYLQRANTCRPIAVTVDNRLRCARDIVDDVCIIEITVDSPIKFVLSTTCVYPGTPQWESHTIFLFQSLVPSATVLPNFEPDI